MKDLTDRQRRVLAVVEDSVRHNGFPPTLREIGRRLDLASVNAVRGHLEALEKKGYITKEPDKARSIRVLRGPSPLSRLKRKLHEVFQTDAGVIHRIVYGLAWPTWGRTSSLAGPWRRRMEDAFEREAVEHGWRILQVRIEADHVVLVAEAWPNHSAETVVRRFQAAGRRARDRHRAEFTAPHLWGRGYAATTDLGALDELVARLLGETPQAKDL